MINVEAWGTVAKVDANSIMEHPRLVVCLNVTAPNLDIQCNVTKRALDYSRLDDISEIISDVWVTVSYNGFVLIEIGMDINGGLYMPEPIETAIKQALVGLKRWFDASRSEIIDLEDRLVANHWGNRAFAARVMAGLSARL